MFPKPIWLVLFLALCMPFAARSEVQMVTSAQNPLRVTAGTTAVVTVRWQVELLNVQPVTVTSTTGEVLINNAVVATPGRALSRRVTQTSLTTVTLTERVRVDRRIINALATGQTVTYRRTFDDGGGPVAGTVSIVASTSGGLGITDVRLRFVDGGQFLTVPSGDDLRATADLGTRGRGVFDGRWEVAGPTTVNFRPVATVRRVFAGPDQATLLSPLLSTALPGTYLVRLAPSTRAGAEGGSYFPVIRYIVLPSAGTAGLSLLTPASGARLGADSTFAWQPVVGASGYRLSFHAASRTQPIAAVQLRGDRTSAQLKPFTYRRLVIQAGLRWQVTAFDAEGRVLATSPLRDLAVARPLQNPGDLQ